MATFLLLNGAEIEATIDQHRSSWLWQPSGWTGRNSRNGPIGTPGRPLSIPKAC